ncbi:MAG: hypothetical protein AAGF48_14125 [Pseudomonadota bacterium]
MERQDWMLGRGPERSISGEDVIEVRDNGAENPIAPEISVTREWQWYPAHQ